MIYSIYDLKQRKANNHWSYLIFIDLKRAYDNVNKSMLLNTLENANISGKFIEIIKIMLLKSWIILQKTILEIQQKACSNEVDFHQFFSICI